MSDGISDAYKKPKIDLSNASSRDLEDELNRRTNWQTERAQLIATIDEKIAAARDGVLNKVKEYADTCIWIDDDCCPGKMKNKEYSDCDGCEYIDYPNNADICEKIESLRAKKE